MAADEEYELVEQTAICDSCQHLASIPPTLQIHRLSRTPTGFRVAGGIRRAVCPHCGAAIEALQSGIPVELETLTCRCGSKEFDFAIQSVEAKSGKKSFDWDFELEVSCKRCNKKRFTERIMNYFKLKRIKIGPTGITVEMK